MYNHVDFLNIVYDRCRATCSKKKKKKNPINQSNKYEIIQSTPEMNRVVTIR